MLEFLHKKTQFRQILATYFAVLTIPCVIALIVFIHSANTIHNDLERSRRMDFDRRAETLALCLNRLETFSYGFSKHPSVVPLLDASREEINMIDLLFKDYPSIYAFAPFQDKAVLDVRAFFNRSGIVYQTDGFFDTQKWLYDYTIHGHPYSEWIKWIEEYDESGIHCRAETFMFTNGVSRDALVFIYAMPIGSSAIKRNTLFISLSRDYLISLLVGNQDTSLVVYDPAGHLLLTEGIPHSAAENGYCVYTLESAYNGWKFEWSYPESSILSELSPTLTVIGILAVFLLIVTPLIAVIFAWQQNRPVRELASILNTEVQSDSARSTNISELPEADVPGALEVEENYDGIKRSVEALLERKRSLEDRVSENHNMVYSATLDRILNNKLPADSSTEALLRSMGFPVDTTCVYVAVVKLYDLVSSKRRESLENLQIQHSVLLDSLQNVPNTIVHSHYNNALLLLIFQRTNADLHKLLDNLTADLARRGHNNIRIGVGGVAEKLFDIHISYAQARQAMYLMTGQKTVVYYNELSSKSFGSLYFPPFEEEKLLRLIHAERGEEAVSLLKQIWKQNEQNHLKPSMMNILADSLRLTLIKALTDGSRRNTDCEDLLENLMHPYGMDFSDYSLTWLVENTRKVSACFAQEQKGRAYYLIQDVTKYLESLYTDPAISLSSVAERFNVSETYLSHQFKEQTGENFGSCLERIRQGQAHVLLTQTALSIEEIAQKIGYSNANTFRKAFKRFHGVNPAEYRQWASDK
ncbi:MAG: helix-turn-helix domain-containing protein [Eubacteriales bacterium]|jgi:AraC-like DNA-binding protein/sugar diacid utilization regulator